MIKIEVVNLYNGTVFYIKGTKLLHREDGPAVIFNKFLIIINTIRNIHYWCLNINFTTRIIKINRLSTRFHNFKFRILNLVYVKVLGEEHVHCYI